MRVCLNNVFSSLLAGLLILTACSAQAVAQDGSEDGAKPPPIVVVPEPEAQPPQADAQTVKLLKKIEAASDKLKTLKARVRYTREQFDGDEQRRFGDFYYAAGDDKKTPTRFAILFDRIVIDGEKARSMKTWFIFDGNWLLERNHENKTATRRELVPKGAEKANTLNLGKGQIPIPLRLKADKVLKDYTVKRLKDDKPSDKQTLIHLKLTPIRPKAKAKSNAKKAAPLDLWFDSKTLLLYRVKTKEAGDEIEILLPRPKPNTTINAETFNTALPKQSDGWKVQEVPIKG